jgi:hypothetical protein
VVSTLDGEEDFKREVAGDVGEEGEDGRSDACLRHYRDRPPSSRYISGILRASKYLGPRQMHQKFGEKTGSNNQRMCTFAAVPVDLKTTYPTKSVWLGHVELNC